MEAGVSFWQEPWAKKQGLTWEDCHPVLLAVSTLEALKQAIADPDGYFANLLLASGPGASTRIEREAQLNRAG